jgi:rhamnopyranosyl-N-acetylglucosaminyl-diphospho-decaprenol beta-1,3/1,4-galactofuranosyltransferase
VTERAGAEQTEKVVAVVVTHRRVELLTRSLASVCSQRRAPDHLIVVDNDDDPRVADVVAATPVPSTYVGSARNLGGAGGFALGMLHALTLGADWVWLADDDGCPADDEVLGTLLDCAHRHRLGEVSPMVCDADDPDRLAFPLRRGLVWRRRVSELGGGGLLPGGGRAPRLALSGVPFGTCLDTAYLHPQGSDEFKPILGGRMHTQYPSDDTKRYFTYRNRGYLQAQRGMRKLVPQEWLRFGWFFLVTRRDPAGFAEWIRLRRMGARERFVPHDRRDGGSGGAKEAKR